jgi:HEPN domain-containing protein
MREEIKNWWEQAKHDLRVSEYNLNGDMLDAAAFYCQQSIEKALKAYILFSKKESPGPIHSLVKLGRIAGLPHKFNTFLKKLSPEYYTSRYPDAVEDVPYTIYESAEVKGLISNAQELIKWLSTQMKE